MEAARITHTFALKQPVQRNREEEEVCPIHGHGEGIEVEGVGSECEYENTLW